MVRWSRVRDWPDWPTVGLVLAIKVTLLVYGAVAVPLLGDRPVARVGDIFRVWNHWDAYNLLQLAEFGYQATGDAVGYLVIFPLFPWAIRAGTLLTGGSFLASALGLSAVCSVAAMVLLRRLVALDEPEDVAGRAVWLLLIYPTAYFLHIGYTESFFLVLLLGAFLAARHGRWTMAGLLCLLAGMTRVNSLVMVPALALEAWDERRRTGRFPPASLGIGAVGLGVLVYLGVNHAVMGDPFAFLQIQREHYNRVFGFPWVGIVESWRSLSWRTPRDGAVVGLSELLFTFLSLCATLVSWRTLRPSYAVWMTGNWLLFTSYTWIWCVPRYTLLMFPIFVLLARLTRRPLALQVLTVASLLGFALYAGLFAQGYWTF